MKPATCDKFNVVKQYYIHTDLENWFKQSLDDTFGVGSLIYHDLYHFNLEYVRFINICGDKTTMTGVVDMIENMQLQTQYQIPWISEDLYFGRNRQQMQSIVEKLKSKNVGNYKISNSNEFSEVWFRFKEYEIFTFEKLTKTKRRLVDRIFRQMAATNEKPILSIFNILSFHKICEPPNKMFTSALAALNGKFLKYLSIEDILSLELANKDHRLPTFDTSLDQVIQKHLEQRIHLKDLESFPKHFKIPAILTYFIYKYRTYIKPSIIIPTILSQTDIKMMSQLFGMLTDKTDKEILPKSPFPNIVSPEILAKYLSPIKGYHIFNNFHFNYYINKSDDERARNTIVLRKRKGSCTPALLNKIFANFSDFVHSQNQHKIDLHLIEIDISALDYNSLAHIKSFANIIFQEMTLDIEMVSIIMQIITNKISFFKCRIQAEGTSLKCNDTPIQVQQIVFKHMSFEIEKLIMILTKCSPAAVLFDDCKFTSETGAIDSNTNQINLSYVEFKRMRFTADLLNVLQYFGEDFLICFNDCCITNTVIYDIYTQTKITIKRIKIMDEHQVTEDIILALHNEYRKRYNNIGSDIPDEIIPQIELYTSKFNWMNKLIH